MNLFEYLSGNPYPGRGILLGQWREAPVIAYFIMGRSENSRNRVFVRDGDGLRTQAFDASKLTDPSLVIYAPVRVQGGATVVTNGDQTDTICDMGDAADNFEKALRTRTFEPDGPIFTPRVSGLVEQDRYRLSILKTADAGTTCQRFFFEYVPVSGTGHIIHTYTADGNPPPSFTGEPVAVAFDLSNGLDAFTKALWDSLNTDNCVALFTRAGGDTRVVNRHEPATWPR
ncbi:MAG: IMP cyclohydrolase [Oscillospiraceae bacterium]|nr:IMP cyclohydrolase [Oscillospiraceae bacterium]